MAKIYFEIIDIGKELLSLTFLGGRKSSVLSGLSFIPFIPFALKEHFDLFSYTERDVFQTRCFVSEILKKLFSFTLIVPKKDTLLL